MTRQRQLAEWVTGLEYSHIPPEIIQKAIDIAVNTWGVPLGASTLPWCRQVYRFSAAQGGHPESTILNYGTKTSILNAVFANSTFGHGFELDDNYTRAGIKAGCVIVPTAFAVGEQRRNSGKEFLTAVVAAFEVMLRVGLAVRDFRRKQGYHSTGNLGAFGGAVASAKLLNLYLETMVHAIGGAAFNSSGLSEAPEGGRGHMKRTFPAMGAVAGIRATLLAREGLTGPETAVDGVRGFARAFGGRMPIWTR